MSEEQFFVFSTRGLVRSTPHFYQINVFMVEKLCDEIWHSRLFELIKLATAFASASNGFVAAGQTYNNRSMPYGVRNIARKRRRIIAAKFSQHEDANRDVGWSHSRGQNGRLIGIYMGRFVCPNYD